MARQTAFGTERWCWLSVSTSKQPTSSLLVECHTNIDLNTIMLYHVLSAMGSYASSVQSPGQSVVEAFFTFGMPRLCSHNYSDGTTSKNGRWSLKLRAHEPPCSLRLHAIRRHATRFRIYAPPLNLSNWQKWIRSHGSIVFSPAALSLCVSLHPSFLGCTSH